ncbi:MAG: dienelactone hydrolase family protein [Bacteroidetes bacterium]|nr:dienelactone hydrolase family protein [Bacteroidota bacterium]
MEIISKNISVKKSARYFLSSQNKNPDTLMFVLHGYGMPAFHFLKEFEMIDDENTLIVSPEGLSRFYTKGFYGNIGASWMTSEDRENEINDYVNYLDEVFTEVLNDLEKKPEKIILLGFSQGGSTVTRWAATGKVSANILIIHSSDIPKDIDFDLLKSKSEKMKIHCVYGDEDKSVRKENFESSVNLLYEKNIKFEQHIFNGGHNINIETVKKITIA